MYDDSRKSTIIIKHQLKQIDIHIKIMNIQGSKPLGQKVTEILRNAIIYGEFKPGERLNESAIAAKLKTSKSPVREAMRNLVSENLVESRNWRGAFVRDVTPKDIEEIYMVLSLIEGTITRLAAANMNEARTKELKGLMREIERVITGDNIKRNMMLSRKLHDFIVRTSGNTLLMKIHGHLRTQEVQFGRVAHSGAVSVMEVFQEHLSICRALLEKDGEKAEMLMIDHIQRARSRALKTLQGNLDVGVGFSKSRLTDDQK
jgi:DNA-binding GntR family transcriptional regulator